jgi:hypothetical protein
MKSEITVRTQGIKGGDAKFANVGCTTIYATDKGQTRTDLVIDLDSFTGSGRTYKRRDNTLIKITFEGNDAFEGTIQQLVHKLNPLAFYSGKALQIKKIKDILDKWGGTSCTELERDHSPSMNSIAGGRICELVEEFTVNGVSTIVYDDEIELEYNDYTYEELPDDVIDEIENIMEDYDVDMEKTESRCQN